MCGIAGIFHKNKNNFLKDNIKKILKYIKHRGPDGSGYFIDEGKIALGNTRLSIQDLSDKGNQPIISKCKRYVIVFNGEIYNFKDLRKKLNQNFNSNSDTEVLLYLYMKFGKNCVNLLKGFFSFAIWDKKKQLLFCARDKFGIKPFYYYRDNNKFIFCSEINPILKMNINYSPNLNSINSYLTSEYYENIKNTFFNCIYKLKPGYYLTFQNNNLKFKKYWDFKENLAKIDLPKKNNDKAKLIYEKIDTAVKLSLVSDTKISIAASGGLDSSILFYHVKKNYGKISSLVSFTFDDKKYSEQKHVENVLNKFGYKANFSLIDQKLFFSSVKKSIKILEEPFSGLPVISYEKCFSDNKKFKVILDGSGLDEAHCGYEKYRNLHQNINQFTQDGTFLGNIISENLKKKSNNNDHELKKKFSDPLKNKMYQDLFFIKLPRALRFRDKISMSNSCELRPSFLDDELISLLFKLEKKNHLNSNYGKIFLRNLYKKHIGKKIAFRNKQQIQTPQREWLKNENIYLKKILNNNSIIWDTNWINKKKFEELYEKFNRNEFNNSFFIWKVLNLNYWLKEFF